MSSEFSDGGQARTSVTIVQINGKQFVSGLFWQPLTRPRAFMQEAREIGKREGMDIVAIRHSIIMQAGFVAKNEGVGKGMYSLAASLASELGNSVLGVFQIDEDQFALIAVHDGAIVPGCDVIGNREEIKDKLTQVYNYFDWQQIIAPESFEFGGQERDIQDILTPAKLKKENQLKALTFGLTSREIFLGAMILALIGAGVFGYSAWTKNQQRLQREAAIRAEQIRQAELAKLNENSKKAQSQKALEHPWAKQPSAEDFAQACIQQIHGLELAVGGWVFQEAKCDGKAVNVSYRRKDTASANDFLAEAGSVFTVPAFIANDGDSATVSVPISIKFGGDDPLIPADEAANDFISGFQKIGIPIKLVEKPVQGPAPMPTLPGEQAAPLPPGPAPDWKTFGFEIKTDYSPEVVFAGVKSNGLRFTEIAVNLKEDTASLGWSVKGELNAK